MERSFVEHVRIQSFGCVRDVRLALTPLHALIGPNDSGKSTILRAILEGARLIHGGDQAPAPHPKAIITFSWPAGEVVLDNAKNSVVMTEHGTDINNPTWQSSATIRRGAGIPGSLLDHVRGASLIRWDPDEICLAAKPLPEAEAYTLSERGRGMPAAYEALLSRDREAFDAIEGRVRELFPSVRRIWLPTTSSSEKELGVELVDGTKVSGAAMSEGLVYWLAFAILPYIQPTPVLLIEEPENGLHPSRITEVVRILREVSKTTQIVIATHSPLVINELQPNEVTLLTRDAEHGTMATPIDRTTAFQAREKVYALGELWLSFADGMTEAALVDAKARPTG